MDPMEKQAILNTAGTVNAHLHDDNALFERMILQTQNNIQHMQAIVEELKQRQEGMYAEEEGYEAVAAMKSHFVSALAHMEQNKVFLESALRDGSAAGEALNHFADGVARIPNN